MEKKDSPSFFRFMEKRIADHLERNRMRTAESYVSTLNSLRRFTSGIDLYFNEINAALAIDYEMYLKKTGVSRNTSSFYMRIFRATFNRAVNMGLVEPPSIPPLRTRLHRNPQNHETSHRQGDNITNKTTSAH